LIQQLMKKDPPGWKAVGGLLSVILRSVTRRISGK
jgi:hypothetical protein